MSGFLDVPPQHAAIVITEDGGGLVEKYREAAYQYRLEGRQVKILGSCRSACILALSVPNVCVGPEAVVMAHHAHGLYSGKIKPDTTKAILGELPDNIRRVIGPNIKKKYTAKATLTFSQMRSLGIADCSQVKPENPLIAAPTPKKVETVREVSKGLSNPLPIKIFDLFTKRM